MLVISTVVENYGYIISIMGTFLHENWHFNMHSSFWRSSTLDIVHAV